MSSIKKGLTFSQIKNFLRMMDSGRTWNLTMSGCLVLLFVLAQTISAETPAEWIEIAQKELKRALEVKPITTRPKNVVFFLGDGMGISTLTAGRIYKGQQQQKNGEEGSLAFEKFPHVGLSKTYNDDSQTPDSAGTATAYFCGQKAAMGVIGVNSHAELGNCSSASGNDISSIMLWAQEAGKSTGLITTTRITHATPAATYAHSPDRDWEADSNVPWENQKECIDIAKQLIEGAPGKNLKVILGGGRKKFIPKTENDTLSGLKGDRNDTENLIQRWMDNKQQEGRSQRSRVVNTAQDLDSVDPTKTDYVFGLFAHDHMEYELKRNRTAPQQPSLRMMVKKAIEILQQDKEGFFLVVEGGRIDHAHHDGTARLALHELVEMDAALELAVQMLPGDDTLFVVTADHSHTLSIVGYPERGNPILKFAGVSRVDNLPYTTLSYANGPGAIQKLPRRNLTDTDTEEEDFRQDSLIPMTPESHGGEDVAIYAKGPFSHLFHSLHEQHYIPIAIDYAACYRSNVAPHCGNGATQDQRRQGLFIILVAALVTLSKTVI